MIALLVLTSGVGAVGVTAADPAVQLSSVTVTPDDPTTGEQVTIEATISNLENSDTTVDVTDRYVRTPGTTEAFARSEDVGSVAPGGTLSVPVSTTFETPGRNRLDINVWVRDEDGRHHSYTYVKTFDTRGFERRHVPIADSMNPPCQRATVSVRIATETVANTTTDVYFGPQPLDVTPATGSPDSHTWNG